MADKSVTAASVLPSTSASLTLGVLGATLAQGIPVYLDPADNTWKAADNNAATPAYKATGITCTSGASGQPVVVATQDPGFTPGFSVAANDVIVLSATAGALCPVADIASGNFLTIVGIGIGSNKMKLLFTRSDVATP